MPFASSHRAFPFVVFITFLARMLVDFYQATVIYEDKVAKYLRVPAAADNSEGPIELEEASGTLQSEFRNRYPTCTLSQGLEQKQ